MGRAATNVLFDGLWSPIGGVDLNLTDFDFQIDHFGELDWPDVEPIGPSGVSQGGTGVIEGNPDEPIAGPSGVVQQNTNQMAAVYGQLGDAIESQNTLAGDNDGK